MYCVKKMTEDLYWVGASDRRLALFENVYPISRGVSYNSYLLLDEKTVLLDTADSSVSGIFFENVEHVLNGRELDYLIVNHMEPDHCALMQDLVLRHPNVKIVCNKKTLAMIKNFFTFDIDSRAVIVGEMDTLCTGKHTFAFVMAPMVHWPEAMVSYDVTTKTLYSADAFGTFGALNGNLYADEVNFQLLDRLADRRLGDKQVLRRGRDVPHPRHLVEHAVKLELDCHGFPSVIRISNSQNYVYLFYLSLFFDYNERTCDCKENFQEGFSCSSDPLNRILNAFSTPKRPSLRESRKSARS